MVQNTEGYFGCCFGARIHVMSESILSPILTDLLVTQGASNEAVQVNQADAESYLSVKPIASLS